MAWICLMIAFGSVPGAQEVSVRRESGTESSGKLVMATTALHHDPWGRDYLSALCLFST